MPRPSTSHEVAQRCQQVRKHLGKRNAQAYVVTDPLNVRYLSGYAGDDAYLFISPKKQYLITDSRYTEQAQAEAADFAIVQRSKSLEAEAAILARKRRCEKVVYEPRALSVSTFRSLRKEMKGIKLVPTTGFVERLREIKSPSEIEIIRSCITIAQAAFAAIRRQIRPGMSEREIAARLEFQMRRLGADAAGFPSIVAVGARGSLPHAAPTDKPAERGSTVLIDWGARKSRYNCDLTRVLVPSTIPPRLRRIYEIVLEAQKRAIERVKPGVKASVVDAAARDYIRRKGYGKRFGHGLGHGVGMAIHEGPGLSERSKAVLKPGTLFTIEPGIYVPGWGGVRIEDMVLVTQAGHEVLTSVPKDLDQMVCSRL
jgi:Xaa-Pro aminopeptidase